MKITKELIEEMVRQQISETLTEERLADKAAPTAKATMALPAAKAVFKKLKAVLDSQGEPGAPERKQEIDLALGALGITTEDLRMIMSALRSQESDEASSATEPRPDRSVYLLLHWQLPNV